MQDTEALSERFAATATRLGSNVAVVPSTGLAEAIRSWSRKTKGWSVGLSEEVHLAFPDLAGLDDRREDWPEVAVGLAMFGVAETGTAVVAESSHKDRLMALLCVRHILLLPESAIVEELRDTAPLLRAWLGRGIGRYVTFTSGPSRTADIEQVGTIGVHGPGELVLLLVEGWEREGA